MNHPSLLPFLTCNSPLSALGKLAPSTCRVFIQFLDARTHRRGVRNRLPAPLWQTTWSNSAQCFRTARSPFVVKSPLVFEVVQVSAASRPLSPGRSSSASVIRFGSRAIVFLPSWDSLTSETVRYLHAPGFPLCVVKTYGFGRVSLVYDTDYLTEELSPPHDT